MRSHRLRYIVLVLLHYIAVASYGILVSPEGGDPRHLEGYDKFVADISEAAFYDEGILIDHHWYLRFYRPYDATKSTIAISNKIREIDPQKNYVDPTGMLELVYLKKPIISEKIKPIPVISPETTLPTSLTAVLTGCDEGNLPIAGQHRLTLDYDYSYSNVCDIFTFYRGRGMPLYVGINPQVSIDKGRVDFQIDVSIEQFGRPVLWRENSTEPYKLIGFILGYNIQEESSAAHFFTMVAIDSKTSQWIAETMKLSQELKDLQDDSPTPGSLSPRSSASQSTHIQQALSWSSMRELCIPPYIQPGNFSDLKKEGCCILWQCHRAATNLRFQYCPVSSENYSTAIIMQNIISAPFHEKSFEFELWQLCCVELNDLEFDTTYKYKILEGRETIYESTFKTRTREDQLTFVVMGDTGNGAEVKSRICRLIMNTISPLPNFVLHTGDLAYGAGKISQYVNELFRYFNALLDPELQLMSSVPLYATPGNHDLGQKDIHQNKPLPLFNSSFTNNDILGYFHYLRNPLNGPKLDYCPRFDNKSGIDDFDTVVGNYINMHSFRFPRMLNYSFDQGNAHVVVLDGNFYSEEQNIDKLVNWLKKDLEKSTATWKFVSIHQPPFSSYMLNFIGPEEGKHSHYMLDSIRARLIIEICQSLGVDLIFSGHVHAYERQKPLSFCTKEEYRQETLTKTAQYIYRKCIEEGVHIDDCFSIKTDEWFDGMSMKKTDCPIYIVSGAGGGTLYSYKLREDFCQAGYSICMHISDHSYTKVDISGNELKLQQISINGEIVDQMTLDKN